MRTENMKFKAWNKTTKEMFEVKKLVWEKDKLYAYFSKIKVCGEPNEVKLLQFSGLHDMDGKEIYEGDLLFEDYSNEEEDEKDWVIVEVIFNDFGDVGYVDRKSCLGNIYDTRLNRSDTRLKKIGNKYENPNVLRKFPKTKKEVIGKWVKNYKHLVCFF